MSDLDHEHYMRRAIAMAANVPDRPFAAVIVDPLATCSEFLKCQGTPAAMELGTEDLADVVQNPYQSKFLSVNSVNDTTIGENDERDRTRRSKRGQVPDHARQPH